MLVRIAVIGWLLGVACPALAVEHAASAHEMQQAGNVSEEDQPVPTLSRELVAQLAGLDEQTLALIAVDDPQRQFIDERLDAFIQTSRPRLLTYRAIWAEMRERYRNLTASAAENAFDPCQFVTDDALTHAAAALREARKQFEQHCAKVNDALVDVLNEQQYRVVHNAAQNQRVPPPYRWLTLSQDDRRAIQRLVRIHEARLRLAAKYPQLQERLSPDAFTTQVASLLNDSQHAELAGVQQQMDRSLR